MRRLDELTQLVRADNPSPMTLEGTNTYLLAEQGHGSVVVVDPGPDDPAHRDAVEAARGDRQVAAVIITHHHLDHSAAAGWAGEWGADLRAFDPGLVPGARTMADGERLSAAGIDLEAVHTPGHASDHLCLRVVQTDVVLTGDHVLGRGSTVVNWPDGDMTAYMASLHRLQQAPGTAIYPGHGPTVEDPSAKVAEYIAHREERRRQVIRAVEGGASDAAAIVREVYADVPEVLHPAAARSVNAVLAMLAEQGVIPVTLRPTGNVVSKDEPSGLGT